jgi:hypothetical protein
MIDFLIYCGPLFFGIFVAGSLIYFVRDAWMREKNLYVPKTRWNAEYYTPAADPFLLEDK